MTDAAAGEDVAEVAVGNIEGLSGAPAAPAAFFQKPPGANDFRAHRAFEFYGFFAIFRGDNRNNTGKHETNVYQLSFMTQEKKSTNVSFSGRLKQLMGEMKQVELAEICDVTSQAAGNYVNEGRIPRADILHRMASHFGVTMEWLLTGESGQFQIQATPLVQEAPSPRLTRSELIQAKATLTAMVEKAFEDLAKKI